MEVFEIECFNLTLPNQFTIPFPNSAGDNFHQSICTLRSALFKLDPQKVPQIWQINIRTIEVH